MTKENLNEEQRKNNKMRTKHINIVLKEMFKRVNEEYVEEYTTKSGWFMNKSWTNKEEDDFVDWLSNYLYKNREARVEIMNYPQKNKKRCDSAARMFCFNYGWTIRE